MDKRVILTFISTIIIFATLLSIKACRKVCIPPVISVNKSEALTNEELVFSVANETETDVQWNFGDGQSAAGINVKHVFTKEGTYNVTALAGEACSSIQLKIEVKNPAPVVIKRVPITLVMPEQMATNNELTFTSETEGFSEYNWLVVETNQTSNQNFLTVSFSEAKKYTIQVSAKGEALIADTAFTINVIKSSVPVPVPTALSIIYPKVATAGNNINVICSTPYISQFSWSIKETGQNFASKSFVTKFEKSGVYTISLSASGNLQGKAFSLNKNVTIMVKEPAKVEPPSVEFSDADFKDAFVNAANSLSNDESNASDTWSDKIASVPNCGKAIMVKVSVDGAVKETLTLEQFKKKQILSNTYNVTAITAIKKGLKGCIAQIDISAGLND